jgi:copper(I)-binding protein
MLHKIVIAIVLIAALALTACGAASTGPQIRVEDAWARPVPSAGGNGAVFMRLVNAGNAPDQLVGAESPAAGTVEVHQTTMEEGVMKMEHIPGLEIPAGGETVLEPGGYHVMLIGVSQALSPGDSLPLTLRFEKSGEMTMDVEVREME